MCLMNALRHLLELIDLERNRCNSAAERLSTAATTPLIKDGTHHYKTTDKQLQRTATIPLKLRHNAKSLTLAGRAPRVELLSYSDQDSEPTRKIIPELQYEILSCKRN